MKLVRNEHYWDMGEDGKPLPYLDGVTFQVIPDDATRILQVQSGELDGAELIPFAREDHPNFQADGNIQMELFPSTRVQYITMNVQSGDRRQGEPALRPEGSRGDELRGEQGGDHPGRDLRCRHADDVVHVISDAAAYR